MKLIAHLRLVKPQPPRKESDREVEAARLLSSWKRAYRRQAIRAHVNDAKTTKITPTESKGSTDASAA